MIHEPVLQKEVLQYLNPKPNENFVDATIGEGGYTAAILQRNKPGGRVLGIELDTELYQKLKARIAEFPISLDAKRTPRRVAFQFPKRLILTNDSYINLKEIVTNLQSVSRREKKNNFGPINGILFDLGMSSWHLEKSGRGFSFQKDEFLDMRYHNKIKNQKGTSSSQARAKIKNNLTARKIVNEYSQEELAKILKEYGEERFAKRIAREIIRERKIRPIKTTFQLVKVIKKAIPSRYQKGRIHFATRTFQALRIAVNDELDNLKKVLSRAVEVSASEGRIVVISFHSLEDRIVKNFFKAESHKNLLKILTKKPIKADSEEIKINHRSRSAKLRVAIVK